MNKITNIFLVFLFINIVYLVSCAKENPEEADILKPSISIVEPTENKVLYAGDAINLKVEFEDDTELKSYKIDISSNFDARKPTNTNQDSTSWLFEKTWTFDKGFVNANINHQEIQIPLLIENKNISQGKYNFTVTCTDLAGNEAVQTLAIKILRP